MIAYDDEGNEITEEQWDMLLEAMWNAVDEKDRTRMVAGSSNHATRVAAKTPMGIRDIRDDVEGEGSATVAGDSATESADPEEIESG